MKKSELTQLTQIIEHLVRKEVRKQLPGIIVETFQNMMGGRQSIVERQQPEPIKEAVEPEATEEDFRMSMREAFSGVTPTGVRTPDPMAQPRVQQPKHYTSNPVLNQILNETTGDLRQRERMVGGAAMMGGYSPAVAMAAAAMPQVSMTGPGEMMADPESPSLSRMPMMPGMNPVVPLARPPMGRPPVLMEGQESTHVPMSEMPEGISALDVARQVPLAAPVAQALTKNYSAMMKLIDKKQKRIA